MIGDVLRWLFWVRLREVANPDRPAPMYALAKAAALAQQAASRGKRDVWEDELRRAFPEISADRLPGLMKTASELQVRALVEELFLGTLRPDNVQNYMTFEGRDHLDRALQQGRGVVLAFPHAGAVMLLIALLSLSGYDFTQVAARGLPPPDKDVPPDLKPTRWNIATRAAREAAEDALPAKYHTMDAPPRELYRTLDRNGILAIAFDGRGGSKFTHTSFLGRPALLASGPWRLAASRRAPVVPAFCRMSEDGRWRLVLRPAVEADPTLRGEAASVDLLRRFLDEHIEPMIREHPEHYARWMLHCRLHAGMDANPLFVDTAPDERWRAHLQES